VIIDQVEAALANTKFITELRELLRATSELELGVVLSVREDVLASLLAQLDGQTNVLRLGPLSPEGAREAIGGPLIERRVTIEEPLLSTLLADLELAATSIATEMRWLAEHAIYPPHLQLACSALYDQLGAGEDVLALRHYDQLGRLDEIVRDYLDRVLETELPPDLVAIARRVLVALVDTDRTRAVRTYAELSEQLPTDARLTPLLDTLRQRGIIVPLRAANGQPAWELVHDSLVPRVLAWSDRQDLARQRALEIVRHHLRGSRGERPSLLTAAELREVKDHAAAIDELDREWAKRGSVAWTPTKLVAHSRRARRDRWIAVVVGVLTVLSVAGLLGLRWFNERQSRRREELLSKADLGLFVLELRAFDWDPVSQKALPTPLPRDFDWRMFDTASDDDLAPSETQLLVTREEMPARDLRSRAWRVEARGGRAILEVTRPGCGRSLVPLARLPGYAARERGQRFSVAVPTCEATRRDMIEIEAGPYISGGRGEPPIAALDGIPVDDLPSERTVDLPAFVIDRTEVSNAAYQQFTSALHSTAVPMPRYPSTDSLEHAARPNYPVAQLTLMQARAYCRFLGKDLPTEAQWEKAMRGGLRIRGVPNPMPRRNVPWGKHERAPANLVDTGGQRPAAIDANPGDVSPYGAINLAGNVQEWTRTVRDNDFYAVRGCSWGICTTKMLPAVAITNVRPKAFTSYELGFRCAAE
jgi:formylglycine-generating enzyme required for sulfatase activity